MSSTATQRVNFLTAFLQLLQKNNGQISVASFMDFALNHPQYGYYHRVQSIGQKGDFVTAPHITSLFGEIFGTWLINRWYQLRKPDNVDLIELGPGHGLLLKDILSVCQLEPDFMRGLQIKCLEINPVFCQHVVNNNNSHPIHFFDKLSDMLVPQRTCFVIANEFFDALPVYQFQYCQQTWFERQVTVSPTSQIEFVINHHNTLEDFCDRFHLSRQSFPQVAQPGEILEINLSALRTINQIASHIQNHGGAALICDYGNMTAGYNDTLQAVYQHQVVDLSSVLTQACDITSHVDFYHIIQGLHDTVDLDINIQTQRQFLIDNGIMQRALRLKNHLPPEQLLKLDRALHRLLSFEQMGSLFKVITITIREQ